MKDSWLFGLILTLLTAVVGWHRTERDRWTGGVLWEGYWIVDGPKGENSPEELPIAAKSVAQTGDRVECTTVWVRGLGLGVSYESFSIARNGVGIGHFRRGFPKFSGIVAGVIALPLVVGIIVSIIAGATRAKAALS